MILYLLIVFGNVPPEEITTEGHSYIKDDQTKNEEGYPVGIFG